MEEKRPRGRPPLTFTDEQIAYIEGLAPFLNQGQIADRLGVSQNGFRHAMERQPRIREAIKRGKAEKVARVAETLVDKALGGNIVAAIFYLKAQAGWKDDGSSQEEPQPLTINLVQPDGTTKELQPIDDKARSGPVEA